MSRIAYLTNQYPKVSHTFIRREIEALESLGCLVTRFSIRHPAEALPDPADTAEAARTTTILDHPVEMLAATVARLLASPARFARALRCAVIEGRRSDRGLFRHLVYLCEAALLLRRLRRGRIGHLHVHFASNPAMVALLCRLLGGPPFSFTAHGPDDFERAARLGLPAKIGAAAFVTSVSGFGRDQLLPWCLGPQRNKIHIVPMGVDQAYLSAAATPIPSAPHLLSVGRLDEQKGQLLLIEAIHLLRSENCPCRLVIAGEGPLRRLLEDRIRELRLDGQIILAGALPAEAIRRQLTQSRLFVLASLAENLPVALMEALAMRRPVVATQTGAVPELVEDGVSGWLAAPGCARSLAGAIRRALDTPAERLEAIAEEGYRRVAARHDVRASARQLLACFQNAAPGPNGAGA